VRLRRRPSLTTLSHRSDSFPSFPPRATFRQGKWPMHEPTRSFPVLAQLPLLRRPIRPITSPRTRASQLHPQSKRSDNSNRDIRKDQSLYEAYYQQLTISESRITNKPNFNRMSLTINNLRSCFEKTINGHLLRTESQRSSNVTKDAKSRLPTSGERQTSPASTAGIALRSRKGSAGCRRPRGAAPAGGQQSTR